MAAALLSIGCDPGEVTVSRPSLTGVSGPVLDVRVVRDGEPVEGANVRHVRADVRAMVWAERMTDAAGLARFTTEGGFLWVVAEWEGEDGQVWGGGEKIEMSGSGDAVIEVPLFPPRTEGVVMSEVFMLAPPTWETGDLSYPHGKYVELANNGTEAVYLDGMLLGKAYPLWGMAHTWMSWGYACSDNETFRNDPQGVWGRAYWRIPGTGTEYPLGPGDVAVIAVVAADHREIHPTMLDLSDAAFEFGLPGAADNPGAANLEWLGPWRWSTSNFLLNEMFWVIGGPIDFGTMEARDDWTAIRGDEPLPYRRMPTDAVHDVAYIWWDQTNSYSESPPLRPCLDPVHPSFDRIPGGFLTGDHRRVSAQRRRVTVDGRSVLLDTNVSAVDFHRAERTPGWLP